MRKAVIGVALALWAAPAAHAAAPTRIIYASDWSGATEIYSVDPVHPARRAQLTFGQARDCEPLQQRCGYASPIPSPDGRKIVFQDASTCPHQALYVANADGTRRKVIARGRDFCAFGWSPSWSPDSRRIAYAPFSGSGVYVVNADGRGKRPFLPGEDPGWSPDGRTLTAVDNGTLLARTGARTRAIANNVVSYAWSPKGTWIALERYDESTRKASVDLIRPNGTGAHAVARTFGTNLAWSADGRYLSYSTGVGTTVLQPATGRAVQFPSDYSMEIRWSRVARRLAVGGQEGLRILDGLSGHLRRLTDEPATSLVWSPDARSISYRAPNGDVRIATIQGRARTLIKASGDYGGLIGPVQWFTPRAGLHPRSAARRTTAQVSANEVAARWPVQRIAADGGRLAYVSCGHIFIWTPSLRVVKQAEPVASLTPHCMTPRTTDTYQIYTLALAGDTMAFGARQGSMSQMWELWWGALGPTPEFTVLERRTGLAGCWDGGGGLGSAVGAAGFVFFATWADHVGPACTSVTEREEIHLIESGACPCPVIASSPGPLVPFDVDAGRLVVGGELATLVLDPSGNQLRSVPVSPLAAQLDESDLVILRQGALLHYDVRNVTLLRIYPLPDVPSGGDCGRPHGVGWECRGARLRLQDLARGIAAYVYDGQVHVLRLTDGVDKTIGPGTMARFLDEGLVYADGARLVFVPFADLR